MLELVTAVRFDGRVSLGRTVPCRLTCETASGDDATGLPTALHTCDGPGTAAARAVDNPNDLSISRYRDRRFTQA